MNVDFEQLEQIPKMMELLLSLQSTLSQEKVEKRWLNTRELALYTGYKFETIKAKIKNGDFIKELHYFKKAGILLFDKIEVDNWVMGIKSSNNIEFSKEQEKNSNEVYDELSSLIAS